MRSEEEGPKRHAKQSVDLPKIGWTPISMPGLSEMPNISYVHQKVPHSLNMTIPPNMECSNLVLGKRKWVKNEQTDWVLLDPRKYANCVCATRRVKELY